MPVIVIDFMNKFWLYFKMCWKLFFWKKRVIEKKQNKFISNFIFTTGIIWLSRIVDISNGNSDTVTDQTVYICHYFLSLFLASNSKCQKSIFFMDVINSSVIWNRLWFQWHGHKIKLFMHTGQQFNIIIYFLVVFGFLARLHEVHRAIAVTPVVHVPVPVCVPVPVRVTLKVF